MKKVVVLFLMMNLLLCLFGCIEDISTGEGASVTDAVATTTTMKIATITREENTVGGSVWIPVSGKKYHTHSGCSGMKNPSEVSLEEAEALDFTPCSRCW